MQINITKTVFRLLGFAKLLCKNRAAKNLRHSGEIAKSQIQQRSALFIVQDCTAKDLQHSGTIVKPTSDSNNLHEKTALQRTFSAAIAKPKIKHKSATFTAQSNAAKNLRHNHKVPNSVKVGIIYCAKLHCKEFLVQWHNREANIKHRTATITAKKTRCKEFSAQ